jgi:predicted aspartyl protease
MTISFRFTRGRLVVRRVLMKHAYPAWPMMAIDTGARVSVVTPKVAQELGFDTVQTEPTVSIIGATGKAGAALLRVASAAIMGQEVRDLRVLCHPLPAELQLDGILGLDFLKHFDIHISNSTETLTLTRWRE